MLINPILRFVNEDSCLIKLTCPYVPHLESFIKAATLCEFFFPFFCLFNYLGNKVFAQRCTCVSCNYVWDAGKWTVACVPTHMVITIRIVPCFFLKMELSLGLLKVHYL